MRHLASALCALALSACSSSGTGAPDAALACTLRAGESCEACFARIGECCYRDPSIGGAAPAIAMRCEGDPDCLVCCDECTARECDEIMAAGDCPLPGL